MRERDAAKRRELKAEAHYISGKLEICWEREAALKCEIGELRARQREINDALYSEPLAVTPDRKEGLPRSP